MFCVSKFESYVFVSSNHVKKIHLNFAAALMSDKKMCLKMGTDNLKGFFFLSKMVC